MSDNNAPDNDNEGYVATVKNDAFASLFGDPLAPNAQPFLGTPGDEFGSAFDVIRQINGSFGRTSKYIGDLSHVIPISVNVTKNLNTAVKFFEEHGWSHAQAIGIAANLHAESNLNPSEVGDGGLALGIGQWHPDRQGEFAKKYGFSMVNSTLEQQLAFVHYELTEGNEKKAGLALKETTDVRSAAAVVSEQYERPAAREAEAAKRAGMAAGIDGRLAAANDDGIHRRADLNLVHADATNLTDASKQKPEENLKVVAAASNKHGGGVASLQGRTAAAPLV